MRTDFETLTDGANIVLHPNDQNPLHKKDVQATFSGGYFFCEGSDPMDGPDYYLGDVLTYCDGYSVRASDFN